MLVCIVHVTAFQCHSRSPKLVPINSPYAISYQYPKITDYTHLMSLHGRTLANSCTVCTSLKSIALDLPSFIQFYTASTGKTTGLYGKVMQYDHSR